MARNRKVGLGPLTERRLGYLLELIKRDPLTKDFLKFQHFDKLYSGNPVVMRDYWKFQDALEKKWGVIVRPIPPPLEQIQEALLDDELKALGKRRPWNSEDLELYCDKLFSKRVDPTRIMVESAEHPIRYTVNNGCIAPALAGELVDPPNGRPPKGFFDYPSTEHLELAQGRSPAGWDGFHARPCFARSGAPLNRAHSVTLSINLTQVTIRQLEDLAKEFKQILRHVLPFAPNAPHLKSFHELDFLRTISPRRFATALMVYDFHMGEGLNFAAIARKKVVRGSANKVERDIKLLYRAIHRTSYQARRRLLDTPAQDEPMYYCPQHGDKECPGKCQYMLDWYKRIDKKLPTDYSGS